MRKGLRICLTSLLIAAIMQSIAFAGDSYGTISAKIGIILNAIAWIGYAVALGMVIYIGIKYTMAAANDKANLKQGVINYLIGACMIVCASAIANIVSSIATGGTAGNATSMAQQIINAAQNAANGTAGGATTGSAGTQGNGAQPGSAGTQGNGAQTGSAGTP